jgi:hypothetical protein
VLAEFLDREPRLPPLPPLPDAPPEDDERAPAWTGPDPDK